LAAVAAAPPSLKLAESMRRSFVTVVGGIDIHRAQLTFDYVDLNSGGVFRERIAPADREQLRRG
jgi:hypothetical protein